MSDPEDRPVDQFTKEEFITLGTKVFLGMGQYAETIQYMAGLIEDQKINFSISELVDIKMLVPVMQIIEGRIDRLIEEQNKNFVIQGASRVEPTKEKDKDKKKRG